MMDYWTFTAIGTIVSVERENVDKSGRKPRYMYSYGLRPESTSGVPDGVSLPDELCLRAKSIELERWTGSADPFSAGDRVEVSARASDGTFYIMAAKKL